MTIFDCGACYGEGKHYASRLGGNDPDVYYTGLCEECSGRGRVTIDTSKIGDPQTTFNRCGFRRGKSPHSFDYKAVDASRPGRDDLVGYGDSQDEAVRDLIEWIELDEEDAAYEATILQAAE